MARISLTLLHSIVVIVIFIVIFGPCTSMAHLCASTGSADAHARVVVGVDAVSLGMTREQTIRHRQFLWRIGELGSVRARRKADLDVRDVLRYACHAARCARPTRGRRVSHADRTRHRPRPRRWCAHDGRRPNACPLGRGTSPLGGPCGVSVRQPGRSVAPAQQRRGSGAGRRGRRDPMGHWACRHLWRRRDVGQHYVVVRRRRRCLEGRHGRGE